MRWTSVLAAAVMAGCTATPPRTAAADSGRQSEPPATQPSEFQPSHHALIEGVVTSRDGQALESVTVVAWRLVGGRGSVLQLRAATDGAGRFHLPVQATVGPEPTAVPAEVVIRGFAYASQYPRGPNGSVAMDSVTVPVTLVPLAQAPAAVQARITLPLP